MEQGGEVRRGGGDSSRKFSNGEHRMGKDSNPPIVAALLTIFRLMIFRSACDAKYEASVHRYSNIYILTIITSRDSILRLIATLHPIC